MPATVEEIIFRGPTVHVGLTTTDGATLVADVGDDRRSTACGPATPRGPTWVRDDAYLVPADAGHSAPARPARRARGARWLTHPPGGTR